MPPRTGWSRPRLRRIGVSAAAAGAVTLGAAAWFDTAVPVPAAQVSAANSSTPHVIAGGPFEASGVVHVPGTSQLLFVDDGRPREIFLMELAPDGSQRGMALSVPLAADVTDLEGITSDGHHFYVVGSQSKKTGFDGDGLIRFTFDPKTRRADGVERIQGLKAWLAANVAELRGTERRVGDDVLNIEGLAWDPRGHRLLLGLRAPIVDGAALIVPIKLIDSTGSFSRENLRVDQVFDLEPVETMERVARRYRGYFGYRQAAMSLPVVGRHRRSKLGATRVPDVAEVLAIVKCCEGVVARSLAAE